MIIDFTRPETAAICHRLQVSDCIAEALIDDGAKWSTEEIEEAARGLCDAIKRGVARATIDTALLSDIERAILVDAIEGSTYAACVDDDKPHRRTANVKALNSAAGKLSGAGLQCIAPAA